MARESVGGVLKCKNNKRDDRKEYYLKLPGDRKYRYAGLRDHKLILAIKGKRLAQKYVKILEHNIRCKELLLSTLLSDVIEDVEENLPIAYRHDPDISGTVDQKKRNRKIRQSENPYKREELILETSFGLFVRTKGELAIAELLYSLGIEFFYERALTLEVIRYDDTGVPYTVKKTYYPDFTIILNSGKKIYWEHKGLMKKHDYVERDIRKENDYNMNRIFQSHNLIVTSEGPKNEIDMDGIMRIVTGWLMPIMNL